MKPERVTADSRRPVGPSQWQALRSTLITVCAPALAILALLIPLRSLLQAHLHWAVSIRDLTEDPNELHGHFYYGLLSNLGVLLWTAAATVCLYSYLVVRRVRRPGEAARYVLCIGVITAWLTLDDIYQIHEHLQLVHISRLATYLAYLVGAVVVLVRFRAVVTKTPYLIAVIALAGFAMHNVIDVFWPPENLALWKHALLPGHFWEDGSKFIGIAAWLSYTSRVALAATLPDSPRGGL